MSAGRVILIVLGSIGVLFGVAVLAGGGFLLWADRAQREDGYLTTPTERFATPTYALTRTRLEVDTDGTGWVLNDSWFGKVRIRGESPGAKTLFMGIGPEADVAKYLGTVAHANVEDIDFDPSESRIVRSREVRREGRQRSSPSGRPPPPGWGHRRSRGRCARATGRSSS